jgi:mono/diheme cytochrome c family protein
MRRLWRPVVAGAAVVVGAFALAQARVFEPSTAGGGSVTSGDVEAGELVFERECAGCHGPGGEGRSGPRLRGTELVAEDVTARVRQGGGVMPAGLVSGQEEADVVAYVVSISSP